MMHFNKKGTMKKVAVAALSLSMLVSGLTISTAKKDSVQAAEEYELKWSDEFNGNTLDGNNWNIEENGNGGGNNELQFYTKRSSNIEVSNGSLKIKALKENYGGKNYTSGRITTQNKKTFKYGKIEARMKLPRFNGAWPAFWMLGNNIGSVGWPACGEMDIMEAINNDNNVYANLHWFHADHNADTKGVAYDVGDRTAWHTYGMEWDANTTKFYVDGHVYQTYGISDPNFSEFREKQFIIFNLAIGGKWPGYTIDDSAFPNRSVMEVDWVRVYQKKEVPTETYYIKDEDVDTVAAANTKFTTFAAGMNSWAGNATFASDSKSTNGTTANITRVGNTIWALQSKSPDLEGIAGNVYHLSTTLTSTINKQARVKVRGNKSDEAVFFDQTVNLQANVPYTITADIKIPDNFEGYLNIDYGYGNNTENKENLPENTEFSFTISNTTFVTHKTFYGTRVLEQPTTKTSSTTKAVTTAKVGTTTKAVTTVKAGTTTKVGTTTNTSPTDQVYYPESDSSKLATTANNTAVARVVVKKAKKSGAKKIKISLKKVKKATGYLVQISKKKKFKKKNILAKKKITKKKLVKKAKFVVKNKKIAKKKKLWVRVRAYLTLNNKKVYGKWSKAKKVK